MDNITQLCKRASHISLMNSFNATILHNCYSYLCQNDSFYTASLTMPIVCIYRELLVHVLASTFARGGFSRHHQSCRVPDGGFPGSTFLCELTRDLHPVISPSCVARGPERGSRSALIVVTHVFTLGFHPVIFSPSILLLAGISWLTVMIPPLVTMM